MSINRWTDKGNVAYTYTIEYYLAINNETMTFAETWMKLEMFMLSKILQAQKDKCHMFFFLTCREFLCICMHFEPVRVMKQIRRGTWKEKKSSWGKGEGQKRKINTIHVTGKLRGHFAGWGEQGVRHRKKRGCWARETKRVWKCRNETHYFMC